MAETIEALERRIDELRVRVREAMLSGERALAAEHRARLKQAEQAWEEALAAATDARTSPAASDARTSPAAAARSQPADPRDLQDPLDPQDPQDLLHPREPVDRPDPLGSLLPLREQVYEALSLLQVPAAPKLIATVHEAFFGSTFPTTRVTSLKRDEERSFRTRSEEHTSELQSPA